MPFIFDVKSGECRNDGNVNAAFGWIVAKFKVTLFAKILLRDCKEFKSVIIRKIKVLEE